ncbi:LTA synthase family protein [Proteus mirabilis]|uniref:LTA synthase family protein n=1 Tax=Proteus mirabilis TaxID=584 RepID=UPI0018C7BDC9|nr:sulfatase-like hydrolase/transferase [Proteus mirabilis]MBG6017292.1 sulfatase-like hydrolase/transferase [Proteus mirabilis]MBU9979069.1 sulfatase-like hydrolase/transferase [Proteus mirabilis]MDX4950073.1 sulfatase-like hydrolase/transferase [Proteus mirabilis]
MKKLSGRIYLALVLIASLFIVFEKASLIYTALLSVSVYFIIFTLCFVLSSRALFSAITTGTLFIIIKFINQLKVHYYKESLLFSDFNLAFDSSNLGTLTQYWEAGVAIIAMAIWLIINMVIAWRFSRKSPIATRLSSLLLIIIGLTTIHFTVNKWQSEWEGTLPGGRGTVTNLIMSGYQTAYHPPYYAQSADYFIEQANRVVLPETQTEVKPDIVVLLQESTVNPTIYQFDKTVNLPDLFMFKKDEGVSAQSPLRVQTFGGGTWLSEFSVLTGLNTDDFGARKNSVFYFVVDKLNESLFRQLKSQGYYTVLLTPFNRNAYHAGYAYEKLGVDEIIQPQELGYPGSLEENLWAIPTQDMINYLKEILKTHTDKPLFIFSLTMYEHGPYKGSHSDDYQLAGQTESPDAPGKFSHYMEKIIASDPAIEDFSHFVANRERPTLFLYFGDHQPNIDLKNYQSPFSNPAHITQFTLRDNLTQGATLSTGELTDINFLGGMLLERARLPLSPYYKANIQMRHLCQGKLNDCEDEKLVDSYKNYIYDKLNVAGGKDN